MILGIGVDLVATARIDKLLAQHPTRFPEKVFTAAERAYCAGLARPAEHYAARWAAKEAVLKALGVPVGLSWHELEVARSAGGAPRLDLHGRAAAAAAALGATRRHLTLSHGDGYAIAMVVLEG